jgi:monothiol glutaredoxin
MNTRPLLPAERLHPAIRDGVAQRHRDIVDAVEAAIAAHPVVVVGMRGNPFVRKARKRLDSAAIAHHDLDYGSYFSDWRRRNALKMWCGWATFPMVFVKGQLIGGAEDLGRLVDSGELQRLLA